MSWRKQVLLMNASEWNNRMSCRSCSYWVENPTNHAKCTKCGCGRKIAIVK